MWDRSKRLGEIARDNSRPDKHWMLHPPSQSTKSNSSHADTLIATMMRLSLISAPDHGCLWLSLSNLDGGCEVGKGPASRDWGREAISAH